MTARIAVSPHTHQTILTASQTLARAATSLNGWTTWESVYQAEAAISRAMDDLRSIKPNLRHLKQEIKREEQRQAVDRAIVARSRREEITA